MVTENIYDVFTLLHHRCIGKECNVQVYGIIKICMRAIHEIARQNIISIFFSPGEKSTGKCLSRKQPFSKNEEIKFQVETKIKMIF